MRELTGAVKCQGQRWKLLVFHCHHIEQIRLQRLNARSRHFVVWQDFWNRGRHPRKANWYLWSPKKKIKFLREITLQLMLSNRTFCINWLLGYFSDRITGYSDDFCKREVCLVIGNCPTCWQWPLFIQPSKIHGLCLTSVTLWPKYWQIVKFINQFSKLLRT
jgi:hypothetical protein